MFTTTHVQKTHIHVILQRLTYQQEVTFSKSGVLVVAMSRVLQAALVHTHQVLSDSSTLKHSISILVHMVHKQTHWIHITAAVPVSTLQTHRAAAAVVISDLRTAQILNHWNPESSLVLVVLVLLVFMKFIQMVLVVVSYQDSTEREYLHQVRIQSPSLKVANLIEVVVLPMEHM